VETPAGELSRAIRYLNGVYTQYINRRYRRVGQLFQGRYKAILIDKWWGSGLCLGGQVYGFLFSTLSIHQIIERVSSLRLLLDLHQSETDLAI